MNMNQWKQDAWWKTNPVVVLPPFTVAMVVVFSAAHISPIICGPVGLVRPVVFTLVPVTVVGHRCQEGGGGGDGGKK